MSNWVIRAAGLAVAIGAGAAAEPPLQPERLDMPPGPPPAPLLSVPLVRYFDGPQSVQVNVSTQQLNIVGDAANEPSIAIDPTAPNRIVIGWRQFDTIQSNFRQAGNAWSNDGGRTWHNNPVVTPGVFRSDPVMETDSDGTFYYYTLPDSGGGWRCELFKSADGGRTWAGPVLANGGDRAWFTIDKTGGIGEGNIYAIWNPTYGCCTGRSFGRDTSGGTLPWPTPVSTPNLPLSGTVAVGPDGEVYRFGRGSNSLHAVCRTDNARDPMQTPTFPLGISVNLGGPPSPGFPGNPAGASGQAWVDVRRDAGPARGHVYVVAHVNPAGDDPSDVMFARSTDRGQTWGTPVRVNNDPPAAANWQWFPSMSVAPSGRIDVTYNSTHESGNTSNSRTYYTFSTDAGQTWAPPAPLGPSWNSTIGWPQQNKIGDYYDQESDDVGVFLAYATTYNGEQDVYFHRIGDYDCNRNGIGDAQDILSGAAADCNGNDTPDSCEIAAGAVPDVNNNGIPDECECYADCDPGTGMFVLDIFDFLCFQNRYAAQDPYACDCDTSTGVGVCDIFDFTCFQNAFAGGCP